MKVPLSKNSVVRKTLVLFLWLGLSSLADACWYNGYSYPKGTVVAGLVCQVDGSWKPE